MKTAQVERKRKANSMPNNVQCCKIRIMQKTFPDFQQASQLERLVAKLSQDRTQENVHHPNTPQPTPKPMVPSPNGSSERCCSSVVNQDTSLRHACNPARPTGSTS
jgi:hypothetical protein